MPPSKPVYRQMRSRIRPPAGLTNRIKVIFRDSAGNRLYAKQNAAGQVQFSGKNAENRMLNIDGVKTMMRRWNRARR